MGLLNRQITQPWTRRRIIELTRIMTKFTRESTADDVLSGINLSGKRAIVTGASSGIGVETARALARAGAEVMLAVRALDAGHRVAKDIAATTGSQRVHVARLDLIDRPSIAGFIDEWRGPLHLLVNNAGIMACPLARTVEGNDFAPAQKLNFSAALGFVSFCAASCDIA